MELINLVQLLPNQNSEEVKSQIWSAYEFGKRHHEGQKKIGDPYFLHCVEVAKTLASWKMDTTTIIAGLLHDTVEDTDVTLDQLKEIFGSDLSNLVDGLTKIAGISYSSRKENKLGIS